MNPDKTMLDLAFNKAIADEAVRKFPDNVEAGWASGGIGVGVLVCANTAVLKVRVVMAAMLRLIKRMERSLFDFYQAD
jgi:hypothetical protein